MLRDTLSFCMNKLTREACKELGALNNVRCHALTLSESQRPDEGEEEAQRLRLQTSG